MNKVRHIQKGVDRPSDPDSSPTKIIRCRRDNYDIIWQRNIDNDISTAKEAEGNAKTDDEGHDPRALLIQ